MRNIHSTNVPIPEPDTSRFTDFHSWSPQVWGVLAALIVLMVALFVWRNIDDKIKLLLVVILTGIAVLYFAT
jgi:hypothetical protein